MRKLFDCGHRGKGRYCHFCEQIEVARAEEAERVRIAGLRTQRAAQLIQEAQDKLRRAEASRQAELVSRARQAAVRRQAARAARAQRPPDAIKLDHLPPLVQQRARDVLNRLLRGSCSWEVGGKRLVDRTLISVSLGLRWRLVLRETSEGLVPLEAMSHEKYNHICTRVLP